MIVEAIIGPNAKDKYILNPTEWLDGRRGDVLYAPIEPATTALPPIVIEIQNTVDASFLRRLIRYCGNVFDRYHVEPIALTIGIHATSEDISTKVAAAPKVQYFVQLPSDHWAQKHLFMDRNTLAPFLDQTPLAPAVAIGYVLMQQQASLLGLEHKDDPTVVTIYSIAKDALRNQIKNEEETIDVLRTVCQTNKEQYKRILDAMIEDNVNNKRLKSYVEDGLLYADTCLRKYSQTPFTHTMPQPPDLPESSNANHEWKASTSVLRKIDRDHQVTDMEYAARAVDQCKAEKKRMNWKKCYDDGRAAGYFRTYKNWNSLKNTFYAKKN